MQATISFSPRREWSLRPEIGLDYLRRFPHRIRERPFWIVQSAMVAITLAHYLMERAWLSDSVNIHHIPVTLYLVAVVYAGLFYGLEGGILTALEAVALSLPSIFFQHRGSYAWIADSAALVAVMGTGALVAWLVEREARQRRLAEATGRRFALLHEVGAAVTQTLELEGVLQDAVRGVARAVGSDRAWISVWDSESSPPVLRAQIGRAITVNDDGNVARPAWEAASLQVQASRTPVRIGDVAVAVPLLVEGRVIGALGTACCVGHAVSSDDVDLLAAMGNQIAIAMENARLYRDERRMRQAMRDYARQITRAQEEERKRIARELHDDIVQGLVLISREIGDLVDACASRAASPCDPSRLVAIRLAIRESAQAVRRFSRDLRPSVLDDLGLVAAIDWLLNELGQRTGMTARLDVSGIPCRLPTDTELHLFRIAQESLRNVERHAHASTVQVQLHFESTSVRIIVLDDGQGFDQSQPGENSLGIVGMQERAKLLGGSFSIGSDPKLGVTVRVTVPKEPD